MAKFIETVIDEVLAEVGRPDDAALRVIVQGFVDRIYEDINAAHEWRTPTKSQTVALTDTHNGIITVPSDYRETIAMSTTEPDGTVHPMEQRDWFVLVREYHRRPLSDPTSRGIPKYWAPSAERTATGSYPANLIEMFPRPDRNLTLWHYYYAFFEPPTGTELDIILTRRTGLLTEALLYKTFDYLEEDAAFKKHYAQYEAKLRDFIRWDMDATLGEEPGAEFAGRSRPAGPPVFS